MRRSGDFRRTTRSGVRVGRSTLVVHLGRNDTGTGTRVGFVVGRAVGPAVTRNRVRRRLRHLSVEPLTRTPAGVDVVVRALPRAATEPDLLPVDLVRAWDRALARLGGRS